MGAVRRGLGDARKRSQEGRGSPRTVAGATEIAGNLGPTLAECERGHHWIVDLKNVDNVTIRVE
ncbi:hypothetical protein CITRIK5_70650 [Citricoccus sp. K5]|nr:hypothetical protein CITRIK5_70650 [Citricoccus sp. K5]